MSGEDDEVTAAERDVIEAAREHVARYSPAALNDSFRTLLAAVDRLAAARDKETT